ncbi:DNA mismatch repair endonuclease MutL [Desulfitobacterium metallireducens]|uniref:DNA mismatch repair protein MutL n=1 Tax=Desulfitobacterium metallireducens DSM 15288 TaxID=871968 RepID=W0ECM3_9FIRM|nr:DNA mismatch repair endonuclease MutL [Desulfitobacterium metallireducens]AHF06954.1 DNA mismatch repair protein MutL [Desulfitobacterium metallireducens DSM 15288]
MISKIQVLDPQSANQIAAGEVVERPVSVVKELVENSLDAGAKQIEITIEGNGVPLIRVRDDGSGISPEDLPQAVLRHATSKIRRIEDLNELQTLGFRGEALPSIASVSRMDITSRQTDSVLGMNLKLIGGERCELQEMGCPPGTTITVEDLFFNTPARRKFLKTQNTEFGLISDTLGRLALARPDVSFTLKHPKQVVFQTPGRGKLLESIGVIYGQKLARQLIPLSCSYKEWTLEGYISPPDLVRSTRQEEIFIVNGRIIRSKLLSRAISEGYHTLIPNRLFPIIVIQLTLPPHEYDVNVHPTKMEIRFQNEKALAQFISEQVRKTLLDSRPVAPFERLSTKPASPSLGTQQVTSNFSDFSTARSTQSKLFFPSLTRPELLQTQTQLDHKEPFTPKVQEEPHIFKTQPYETRESFGTQESNETQRNLNNCMTTLITDQVHPLLTLRPLGQILGTYILASNDESLVIMDQHAAHERINYERILKEHQHNPGASQTLLIPTSIDFSPIEEQALLENLPHLTNMGFILEHFGGRTYLIRGVPAYSGPYSGEELLRQFLEEVVFKQNQPAFDELLREWIYMLACKESIKAKEKLSLLEMQELLVQLSKTENPYTCPHGRPTIIKLTRSDLEKRFYRI